MERLPEDALTTGVGAATSSQETGTSSNARSLEGEVSREVDTLREVRGVDEVDEGADSEALDE